VLVAVMALAGLWHGASWSFVCWGVGWALVVLLWRLLGTLFARLGPAEWLLTLGLVMMLWVFFRAPDLSAAFAYLAALTGHADPAGTTYFDDVAGSAWIVAGCGALLLLHALETRLFTIRAVRRLRRWDGPFLRGLLIGLAIWLVLIPRVQQNPFIY